MRAQNKLNTGYYYEAQYNYCKINFPRKKLAKKRQKKSKVNVFALLIACSILGAYGYYICPYMFENFVRPLYFNRFLNRKLVFDSPVSYVNPKSAYIHNSYLFNTPLFIEPVSKSKDFTTIKMVGELSETKQKLLELFKKYPYLTPSVYVWEYSTGKGLEIRADEPYESASIIKIPIAFELMRLIDESQKTQNPIKLTDKRKYTNQYKTLGSGHLQYTKTDVDYTLDYLANEMIAVSDNSATNMLLYEIGGMDSFNRAMRNIGLKTTSMGQWLPDLEGYNKITAREISEILYNINNPYYIPPKYKNVLKEYLGNTKNIHLLKEKLPPDTMVLHKTGNIATMLGDSGIIYTSTGKKYIVTILVKRPRNNYNARFLIQDASLIIYNDINKLN